MQINSIDLITILGYFLSIAIIGIWSSRKAKGGGAANYFTSKGQLSWWAIGMAYVSTGLNSEQLIGMNGMGYQVGLPLVNSYLNAIFVFTFLIYIFFPMYLRNGIVTMPQYLGARFDKRSQDVFSILLLLSYIFLSLAVVLYGGAKLFEVIYDVPIWVGVLILALVSGVITIFGGMSSMVSASVLQFVLMFAAGAVLFYLGISKLPNGWQDIVDHAPGGFHLMQELDTPIMPWHAVLFSLFNLQLYYSCINQSLVQRGFGAKTEWDTRMAIVFALGFVLLRPFLEVFPGMIGRALAETGFSEFIIEADQIDNVYPLLIAKLVPLGMQGLIIIGILGAVMSTISAFLNSISTLITYDVYKKWINKTAEDKQLIKVGKWSTLILMLFSVFYAPLIGKFGGIFIYFQSLSTYMAVPIATCFIFGMFWKRTTPFAALMVLLIGIPLGAFIQYFVIPSFFSKDTILAFSLQNFYVIGGITQFFCALLMVLFSYASAPRPTEEIKPYLWNKSMIRLPKHEQVRPIWQSVELWWAIMLFIYLALYILWW